MNIIKLFGIILFSLNLFAGKVVIVEIDDVLFDINETEGYKLFKGLVHDAAEHYRNRLFEILFTLDEYKVSTKIYYKGVPVPPIWSKYYLNDISKVDINKKALDAIHKHTSWISPERQFLKSAISIAFEPSEEVKVLFPNKEIISLLKKCKQNGNSVVIFSNKNKSSLKHLVKRHPEVFEIFGDNIIISGEIKKLKPQKESYEYIFEKFNVNPEDCFIIESQKEYLKTPKDLGMNSILYKNNIEEVKKKLKMHKIIK